MSFGFGPVTSSHGLAARALRDITKAIDAGRFEIDDPEIGLVVAGGAALALDQLLHDHSDRDAGGTADQTTSAVLRRGSLDCPAP